MKNILNNMKTSYVYSIILCVLLITSCKRDNDVNVDDFNQIGLLTNIGNNIVSNYETLNSDVEELEYLKTTFLNTPTSSNFLAFKNAFIKTYKQYQHVSLFNFGPAANTLLKSNLNTYPTDTNKIKNALSSGSYNLAAISNYDMKGLPALDYLLAGVYKNENNIIAFYTTNPNALNHQKFLSDIISDMKTNVFNTYNAWSSGNYLNSFISNTGKSSGSSISLLVNYLNIEYESYLRNAKIAIPAGIISTTIGTDLKYYCEAYYSGISLDLLKSSLTAINSTYTGLEGLGFDDYLISLEENTIHNDIEQQFTAAFAAIENIPGPLSNAITVNETEVILAYQEVQNNVVNLKVKLPASLGVLIDIADNDND